MKLSSFIMWQLMNVVILGLQWGAINHGKSIDYEKFILKFDFEDMPRRIELHRTKRALANIFLPAWLTTNDLQEPFIKINIKDHLGEISFYHDSCTKSAFVYFHDKGELSGVIDLTYFIKGLKVDGKTNVLKIKPEYLNQMYTSKGFPRWIRSLNIERKLRSRRMAVKKIYLQLQVAIEHETFIAIEKNSVLPRGIATVCHVLVAYNAADMLYSFVSSFDMYLNIAGIVIEGVPHQWNFESEYKDSSSQNSYTSDATSVHPKLSNYFWQNQNHFPRHSFDFIIYHTRSFLVDATGGMVNGLATRILPNRYMFPPDYHKDRDTVVLTDYMTYKHFKTIAHEVAHLLGVHHDHEGPNSKLFDAASCELSLMSKLDSCSRSCLVWSSQTEAEFSINLRPPFVCSLMNYPRSLFEPRPRYELPASLQCRCYGFDSHLKASDSIPENACRIPLTCISKSTKKDVEVPLPIDGTACGEGEKLCWNGHCVQYQGDEVNQS